MSIISERFLPGLQWGLEKKGMIFKVLGLSEKGNPRTTETYYKGYVTLIPEGSGLHGCPYCGHETVWEYCSERCYFLDRE